MDGMKADPSDVVRRGTPRRDERHRAGSGSSGSQRAQPRAKAWRRNPGALERCNPVGGLRPTKVHHAAAQRPKPPDFYGPGGAHWFHHRPRPSLACSPAPHHATNYFVHQSAEILLTRRTVRSLHPNYLSGLSSVSTRDRSSARLSCRRSPPFPSLHHLMWGSAPFENLHHAMHWRRGSPP